MGLPILNVFANNEEIGLDEPLNDLTVSLFPGRKLPRNWNRLQGKKKK